MQRQEPLGPQKSPPSPPLLPAPFVLCQSLLTAGSKRDHDEWLGWRGRVGGASALPRLKARQEGPVRRSSRSQRGESGHGHFPRIARSPPWRRPEEAGTMQGRPPGGPAVIQRSRDAAGDAPRPSCHRLKTPDRPARLKPRLHCGLPARGKRLAGPA